MAPLASLASGIMATLSSLSPRLESLATTNPIKVNTAATTFVGYRNSTNTETVRDLGFMGNIGATWMMSFGDGIGTKNHATFDATAGVGQPNGLCAYITARDGGGIPSSDPLKYSDITVIRNVGACGDTPQMGYWCPKLSGEEDSQGLGITNVVEVNSTHGVIYTRPTVSGSNLNSAGAGLAVVQLQSSGPPQCTRPFGKSAWTQSEPDWGQLSAISGNDGYTYVFANGYNGTVAGENNKVVLARAPKTGVFNLNNYQYWNGTGFNSKRILISDLSTNGPQNLVGLENVGQGTAWYSTYYNKFVYFNMGIGFDNRNLYAWTADKPQGPWSERITVYVDQQPEPPSGFDYGGYVMGKYTGQDGKTVYVSWTRAGYAEGVVKLVFQ